MSQESASKIKNLVYTKMSKKIKTCQKCFTVHSLDLLGANTRSFQVKALISKDLLTLARESQFILVNSNCWLVEIKFWPIVKLIKKLKTCQKGLGVHFFGNFFNRYQIVPNKDTHL